MKIKIKSTWLQQWNEAGENRLREITGVLSPWKYSHMPRRWETALRRLRTGRTHLIQEYLMAGSQSPAFLRCLSGSLDCLAFAS